MTSSRGAKRIVVKVGSSLVTNDGRGLDHAPIAHWAAQIAALRALRQGSRAGVLGRDRRRHAAARTGRRGPPRCTSCRPPRPSGRWAWCRSTRPASRSTASRTAQVLLTHADLADRSRYLNARSTLFTLLRLGVVPVINENDTVVTDEIKFGDNDTLGALVANLIEADALVHPHRPAGPVHAPIRARTRRATGRRRPRRRPGARGDGRRHAAARSAAAAC